ncbi:MAG: TRAFs-binding domain-containing protein [Planctomycetaceae bacterium]
MSGPTIADVLKRLRQPGTDVLDLYETYQTREFERLWNQDQEAQLSRAFASSLIEGGHPTLAVELVREALQRREKDPKLRPGAVDSHLYFLIALGYARSGNIVQAEEYHKRLEPFDQLEPGLREDAICFQGRLCKDRYQRATSLADQRQWAKQATVWYRQAYDVRQGLYPLVNWATTSVLAGDEAQALELATQAVSVGEKLARQKALQDDYWLFASIGEAYRVLRKIEESVEWYRRAVKCALEKKKLGAIVAMRPNLLLLKPVLGLPDSIWEAFNLGKVVAFAGHMLDTPSDDRRRLPRFPNDPSLVKQVSLEIADKIKTLNAQVGFCSAACGSDILFAEQMQFLGAELHIVLPFQEDDFYRTSIDFGREDMGDWRERCRSVISRAKKANRLHYATREPFLDDMVLFEFVNTYTQGLAMTRARERGSEPWALVVLDPDAQARKGGTRYFVDQWKAARPADQPNCEVIDLKAQRVKAGLNGKTLPPPPLSINRQGLSRQLKFMLFADVKGSSKIPEASSPMFAVHFLGHVEKVLKQVGKPDFVNTAGDGVFVVFKDVSIAADFALRLLERLEQVDWQKFGFTEKTPVRIALHAGPVFPKRDPVLKRRNYFGSHVNFASRLEPSTTPGCIFTSEQFAAVLAVKASDEFACVHVGTAELIKGAGRHLLYRLERRPKFHKTSKPKRRPRR